MHQIEQEWGLAEAQKHSYCSVTNGDERGEGTYSVLLAHSRLVLKCVRTT